MSQSEQPRQKSRVGWYLLGCFAVFLVLAAACVLGGLFVTNFYSTPSTPLPVTGTVTP
jgi:hypothetical protein